MESKPSGVVQTGPDTLARWLNSRAFPHRGEMRKEQARARSQLRGLIPLQFIFHHHLTPQDETLLPSGLNSGEVSSLVSALVEVFKENPGPIFAGQFLPQNILISKKPGSKLTWQLEWLNPLASPGEELTGKETVIAFARLIYVLVNGPAGPTEGNAFVPQMEEFPRIAAVLGKGLDGKFRSITELGGAFGWSVYQQFNLNFFPKERVKGRLVPIVRKPPATLTLPTENITKPPSSSRNRYGLPGALSLGLAIILLLTFGLISLNDFQQDYSRREGGVNPTGKSSITATPLATTTPTPGVAVQNSRQINGAVVTHFNPAYFSQTEPAYTNPASIPPGEVVPIGGMRSLWVLASHWSSPDQVDLALNDGGWESWDTTTKQRLSRRELPNADQFLGVSWSPDGQRFAAIGIDGQLRLGKGTSILKTIPFGWPPGNLDWQLNNTTSNLFSWSPDGSFLTVTSYKGGLDLWNMQNFPYQIQAPSGHSDNILDLSVPMISGQLAWSPDSHYLAWLVLGAVSSKKIAIYDPFSLSLVKTIDLNPVVTSQNDNSQPQGSPKYYLDDTLGSQAFRFSWSKDGRFIAYLRWYTTETGSIDAVNKLAELTVVEVPGFENLLSPGSVPSSIPVQPETPRYFEQKDLSEFSYNYNSVPNLLWSDNDRLLVLGQDAFQKEENINDQPYKGLVLRIEQARNGTQESWNLQEEFRLDALPKGLPLHVSWSPGGHQLLFNTANNSLALLKLPTQNGDEVTIEALFEGNRINYPNLLVSPDGQYFTSYSDNKKLSVYNQADGKLVAALDFPGEPSTTHYYQAGLTWSPDGRYLVLAYTLNALNADLYPKYQTIIRAWKFEKGSPPELVGDLYSTSDGYNDSHIFWDVNSSAPAVLFNISTNKIARWDLTQPLPGWEQQRQAEQSLSREERAKNPSPYYKVAYRLPDIADSSTGQTWYPNQKKIIIGSGNNLYLYDMLSPDAPDELLKAKGIAFNPQPPLAPNAERYFNQPMQVVSPDNRMVAVGAPTGLVNLYDASTGKLFNSFAAHQGIIGSIAFSPDGQYLVTAATDRSVKVWDTKTWRLAAELRGIGNGFSTIQWLPDSQTLAINNSGFFFWHIPQN